ncbi:MAG: hypothetical protein ACI9V1_001362 [Spirosomataceae bacterium]|jgi:hypothetical protein
MKKLFLILTAVSIGTTSFAQRGSGESSKRIASAQLNEMVVTNSDGDNSTKLKFFFNDCDLNMKVAAGEGDAKFNINVVWDMVKSNHVFYEIQDEPNHYAVKLGVPAEDIRIKFSLGKKLTVNANLDDSDVDDFQELSILSNDWKEVDDLAFRLNKIAAGCKGT